MVSRAGAGAAQRGPRESRRSRLAAGAVLVATTFVGLGGLETAAAMRVLAPDRHVPPPPSTAVRRARRAILGPLGMELEIAETTTVLPADALPTREELPAGHGPAVHGSHTRARRGGSPRVHVGVPGPAVTPPGPRGRRRRQLRRRHGRGSRRPTGSRSSRRRGTPRRRPAH